MFASQEPNQRHGWPTWAEDLFPPSLHAPGSPRWIDIPKPNRPGETRRIGILSIRDRVAQNALKQVLEPVLEPTFSPNSLRLSAGPLGRGRAGTWRPPHFPRTPATIPDYAYAVPLDVADCFPSIEHNGPVDRSEQQVAEGEVRALVGRANRGGRRRQVGRWWWKSGVAGLCRAGALAAALQPCPHPARRGGRRAWGPGQTAIAGRPWSLRYADDLRYARTRDRRAKDGAARGRHSPRRAQGARPVLQGRARPGPGGRRRRVARRPPPARALALARTRRNRLRPCRCPRRAPRPCWPGSSR